MWSPINIAKVDHEEEQATTPPLPPQEATPGGVAEKVGTDEIFAMGNDVPSAEEGTVEGETEDTDDRTETTEVTPHHSPVEHPPADSATPETVAEGVVVDIDEEVNGANDSPSVHVQDAASKSETAGTEHTDSSGKLERTK